MAEDKKKEKPKEKGKDKSATKKPKDIKPPEANIEGESNWFETIHEITDFMEELSNTGSDFSMRQKEKAGTLALDLAGLLKQIEDDNHGETEQPEAGKLSPKVNVASGEIQEKRVKKLKDVTLQQNKAMIELNNKLLSAMKIL